jgi:uracil-DNA glycosylase family 4
VAADRRPGCEHNAGVDPHPGTGELFASPVRPGTGWPGDLATPRTPRAKTQQDVVRLGSSTRDLATLDARSSVCRACPRLVEWRESVATGGRRASFRGQPYWGRPSPGFGDPHPGLLIVGLAPAANGANRTGRIFTGDRSGDWLYAALYRAGYATQPTSEFAGDGLELKGARITAAVRCAPPDNKPTTTERDTCSPWLEREIQLVAPPLKVVLALGGFGFGAFLTTARRLGWAVPRPKPAFGHGVRVPLVTASGAIVHLLGCYHVSQQNTFTGRLTEAMIDDVLATARALTG